MKKTILQRILKTDNKEELNEEDGSVKREEQKSERVRNYSGVAGGSWIKKRGNYSARNPIGPIRTNAMKAADRSGHSDPYNIFSPRSPRTNFGSSPTHPEMFDLETIICEFEKGFLSPSKHEGRPMEIGKQRNFVKKIVAAFEVKYKACNDPRGGQEGAESNPDTSCGEAARKRSEIFEPIPFDSENLHDDSMSEGEKNEFENRSDSNSMGETYAWPSETYASSEEDGHTIDLRKVVKRDETEDDRENVEGLMCSNGSRKSAIFSSGFGKDLKNEASENFSDAYLSSLNLDRRGSNDSDCSSLFIFDKEQSCRRSNFYADSKVAEVSLDDTMEGTILDLTLPNPERRGTSSMESGFPKSTSTMINEFPKKEEEEEEGEEEEEEEGSKEGQQISRNDKTPKIVGAFLKRPIEVEDTSIDWIPIPGKKLPRKKSLKKLLYSLTGKRLDKKRKLFSSERNLNEGEYQDSGYDERSCSSSSLTSLASITDVLGKAQRENSSLLDSNREFTFNTFKSNNLACKEENGTFYHLQGEENAKKLILNEVPRESLRLDLGPSYPPLSLITQMALKPKATRSNPSSPSLVKGTLTKLPKHPHLSKIRKHPFISLTKMDNSQEFCSSYIYQTGQHSSVIIKNDMYEVEIRRRSEDIPCPFSHHSSTSAATHHYDVPRKFLSKSETEIWAKCQCSRKEEPIYDVPKLQNIERSKSSDYEEVLSSKRKNAVADREESGENYATADNAKNCLNDEMRFNIYVNENSIQF